MNKTVALLHRRVKAALAKSGLSGKSLVVAVSGGPDSLALVHAIHHLRDELGLRLHGAHLDHGLRGDASRADARFVAGTFDRLSIPYTHETADVGSVRRGRRLSLEEAAREVRYAFLSRVSDEQHADAVAVGHTADDQAETVLMHVIRGSGLTGLRGMEILTRRPSNGGELVLVRPLLSSSRRDTADYCRALALEPRHDETNASSELTRNRIRAELLPLLEEYNPAIRDALVRLSHSAAQDVDLLESEVQAVWEDTVRQDRDGVAVNRAAFARLAPALQSHLLRRAVRTVKGDLTDVEQNHVEDMARLMAGPAGRSLDLPGGIRYSVGYDEAVLRPPETDPCLLVPLEGEYPLDVPGETLLPGWLVTAGFVGPGCHPPETSDLRRDTIEEHTAYLDYDALDGQLWVRSRIAGDRFQPLGMSQPKKLQDFMVDSKIPRARRDRVPLVVSPRGIAWVVGWRIAEWAKVRGDEARLLELGFVPK